LAAIDGPCIGGGLALALACDFRIATPRSRFAVTPAKLGLVYPLGDTRRLIDCVGAAYARHLLLTAALLDAEEAYARGLVTSLCEEEGLGEAIASFAKLLDSLSPSGLRACKRMIARALSGQIDEDAASLAEFPDALAGADFAEGLAAFFEKRPPRFHKD
jgi:enoyl-CoA hydratase/carnithine racemase